MNYTSNLRLKKPEPSDFVNVNDLNDNFEAIDRTFGTMTGGAMWKEIARFEEPGEFSWTSDFDGKIGVLVVGGGGSGCATYSNKNSIKYASGGNSGEAIAFAMPVIAGNSYSGVVGNGGARAVQTTVNGSSQNKGEESRFENVIANGGAGGSSLNNAISKNGGAVVYSGEFGSDSRIHNGDLSDATAGKPWMCINPFTMEQILGSGGGRASLATNGTYTGFPPKLNPVTGCGGGNVGLGSNGGDATEFGCGGGAAIGTASGITAGAGGNGIVLIYKKIEVNQDAD